jgi:tetratricopeptide (TPR) repeat protein
LQGLVGDNSETTVLLQFLADRYRELGQGAVATTLLNRALVHHAAPGSVAHAESLTQAQLALAQALAGEGAAEQAQAAYRRVLENPVPPLRPGFAGATACLASLDAARKVASKALAASLTQQGRFE